MRERGGERERRESDHRRKINRRFMAAIIDAKQPTILGPPEHSLVETQLMVDVYDTKTMLPQGAGNKSKSFL